MLGPIDWQALSAETQAHLWETINSIRRRTPHDPSAPRFWAAVGKLTGSGPSQLSSEEERRLLLNLTGKTLRPLSDAFKSGSDERKARLTDVLSELILLEGSLRNLQVGS